jgi:hypothetical protein
MKKTVLRSALMAIAIIFCNNSYSQFNFSVSPGLQLNGATFGYRFDKFYPYIGLQLLHVGSSITEEGRRANQGGTALVDYEDKFKFTGTAYLPVLGLKYFFLERNKLKAYGNICFTKAFLSAKLDDDNNPGSNIDLQKLVDGTRVAGAQIGFGTEYFFDDNFSLGGEFGLRMLHVRNKMEQDNDINDPGTGNPVTVTTTTTMKLNANPTYTKISLNFYF